MLKITKDVTIRHDGQEIKCKAGEIVNVKASFDVNDAVAKGIEVRYADKFKSSVKRVIIKDGAKVMIEIKNPEVAHNEAEQKIRKEKGELVDNEELEVIGDDEKEEEKTDGKSTIQKEVEDYNKKQKAKKAK